MLKTLARRMDKLEKKMGVSVSGRISIYELSGRFLPAAGRPALSLEELRKSMATAGQAVALTDEGIMKEPPRAPAPAAELSQRPKTPAVDEKAKLEAEIAALERQLERP